MSRIVLILALLPLWCFAARPYTPRVADPVLESWRWREMKDFNGLGVRCVDEDQNGTLWFGCVGSIVQYDGMQMRRIPFDKELLAQIDSEIPHPPTHALLVARDNRRLMVISSSLVCQSADGWEIVVHALGATGREVDLKQDKDGFFWVLTDRKVLRISEDFSDVDPVIFAKRHEALLAFCLDSSGNLWVAKHDSRDQAVDLVYIPVENGRPLENKNWKVHRVEADSAGNDAALEVGPAGNIWYVDNRGSNDILSFDPQRKRWRQLGHADSRRVFYSLVKDHQGTLWASGRGELFAIRKDPGFYEPKMLGLPAVPLTLFTASDRRWWVISRSGQVYLMGRGGERWKTYTQIHFECESEAATQWFIKSDGGVVSHDSSTGKWLQYDVTDGLMNKPLSLTASSHGLIWAVGSHNNAAAISVFDGEKWTLHRHPELSELIGRDAVLEAKDGTMWFGAVGRLPAGRRESGGALQYGVSENGEVQLLTTYVGTALAPRIKCFSQTPDGKIWIGSPDIKSFDPLSGELQPAEELPLTGTLALILDGSQTLWALKDACGLFRKEAEGWRYHTPEDALRSGMVTDVVPLQDGTLLMATEDGIFRYDGQVWVRWAISGFSVMVEEGGGLVQAGDGSIWFNFNSSENHPSRTVPDDKKLFFTVRYVADAYPPETSIKGAVKKVASPGNAVFSWAGHDRWGDTPGGSLQYSWRLNGGEWSPFSYTTDHNFVNLDEGQCVLEVRARDRDLNVDPTPARLQFVVIPPIWKQGWFILMVISFVGMILGLLWVIYSSRIRHLEERQKDRERYLMKMDQLKVGFFINISHELRTPLTVILGPLQDLLAMEKDERKRQMLTMMERNTNRIATLITQLLDFRKIEQGSIRLEITEGDLATYVQGLVESLQPMAEQKGLAAKFEKSEACRGWFDPDKLHKILTNLVTNALKYTPVDGAVTVSMKKGDPAGRWVEFSVEDSGSGIDSEHLEHIFERFYQIPRKVMIEGVGIGLNLTKELVDLYGGQIRAESPVSDDPERPGSRFTVRLPIAREEFPAEVLIKADPSIAPDETEVQRDEFYSSDDEPSSDAADELQDVGVDAPEMPVVLVVEDDGDIRAFIMGGLQERYRIVEAVNGDEGLEMARRLVPDLVVTDLMMPVMDGMDLCRKLKENVETSHIPVLMLTAKTALEQQVKGLEAGAVDYLTKPFHMMVLQTKIANLLESRRRLQQWFQRQWAESLQGIPGTPEVESGPPESLVVENRVDKEFWENLTRVLEENICDAEFNTTQLATVLNMGPRSLQRKIKALTDLTPVNLIVNFRLQKSVELLRDLSFNITEIAFEVGFNDSNHYYKQFKKKYDMSPSEYRSRLVK